MKVYYDSDADSAVLLDKRVAIIGYGSQGHAQALNLRDSGVKHITIGLKEDSASRQKASQAGFPCKTPLELASESDILVMLAPDELQAQIYQEALHAHLKPGAALVFSHGLNVHFRLIEPRSDLDVFMVAPKGPGHTVRAEYLKGGGVPCLLAVAHNPSGTALECGLAYAVALGGGRAGILETSFREECETDLFGEQVVLCGGLTELIRQGFEVLVEAGYAPEMAYFECLHEVKLIVDLMYEGGMANMRYSVSNTAEYGDYKTGQRIITRKTREEMKKILAEIQTGRFVRDWVLENRAGQPHFKAERRLRAQHPLEQVGSKLRAMMPWIGANRLVDKAKN